MDQMRRTVSELQDMGVSVIGLTGGEPLLRRDLAEIVSFIDPRSTSILYTSGYTLSETRAVELQKAGLFGIAVSIDHADPQVHDGIRGFSGAYGHATKAVAASIAAGLYTMVQAVLNNQSFVDDIWAMVELARSLGAHEIRLLDRKQADVPCSSRHAHVTPMEVIDTIERRALRTARMPKVTFLSRVESPAQMGCCAAVLHSYIGVDGSMRPCDFSGETFGNVFEAPVAEVWRSMVETARGCSGLCAAGAKTVGMRRDMPEDVQVSGFFRKLQYVR